VKPIGTITNFYPFLKQKTLEIVKPLLKDAEGFDDFVMKLVEIVLNQDEPNDLLIFTTIQAWVSGNHGFFYTLRPRLLKDVILKPWLFFASDGTTEERNNDFSISIKHALEASSEDWVRLHLLMIGARWHSQPIERQNYLSEAKELLESQSKLTCFSPEIHIRSGQMKKAEGNLRGAMEEFEDAKKIAELYNDVIGKCDAVCDIAISLKETDVYQALDLMEESFETFESLGANTWAGVTASNMGFFHTLIGEYDLAIELYREGERIFKIKDSDNRAVVHSRLYCDIDRPEKILEWIKLHFKFEDFSPSVLEHIAAFNPPSFQLAVARPLVQQGKFEDVTPLLSETHRQILQKGAEIELFQYNHVFGLYEIAKGNLDTGLQSMADALAEAERLNVDSEVNSILLSLTKAEVRNIEGGGTIDSSGQWMTRYGIHAREKNYRGIMMLHALLKAEYQEMIGEPEAARLTLKDALTFTDSLGVVTLRKRIMKRLEEIDTPVEA
jgi:tetratricopeptide (TPR) repeat protein